MRTALLISLLFFAVTNVTGQSVSDLERDGLKGPVQTVRTRKATILDENAVRTETPLVSSHDVTYDKSGSRTELVLYNSNGLVSRRIVYTYEPKSKRRSGLITYDSNNSMVRKVVDTYGKSGSEKTRAIEDFNEDGSLYRKMELTYDSHGELTEVAEYGPGGTLIKKEHSPFKEPELNYVVSGRGLSEEPDRLVSFSSARGEYFDSDSHGNWTRAISDSTSRTYASGKKIKQTEMVYRELIYY